MCQLIQLAVDGRRQLLPAPAHAALAGRMPGWQITLIPAAAVLTAAAAVLAAGCGPRPDAPNPEGGPPDAR